MIIIILIEKKLKKSEDGSRKTEDRGRKSEAGSRKPEVRCQLHKI